jgi:uncharacterized protein YndB with AHSA1/START domain
MIRITTDVRIERPLDEVFGYVAEPRNLPAWNSAVTRVRERPGAPGASYVMEREVPGGRAINELEVIARQPGRELSLRTTSGPTPFVYRIHFAPTDGATVVTVDAEASLGRLAELAAPLARQTVKRGVQSNLTTLKSVLEGRQHAVRATA